MISRRLMSKSPKGWVTRVDWVVQFVPVQRKVSARIHGNRHGFNIPRHILPRLAGSLNRQGASQAVSVVNFTSPDAKEKPASSALPETTAKTLNSRPEYGTAPVVHQLRKSIAFLHPG